ncbi:ATP-dependent RNA helicase dbp6 [Paramarasmius palmivorus]|uniref:ATP-dependent RNA helicase n=1 Tax=Paramarasmius palmivorus TaxID=297713 RepID=A0AAW0D026_9AGAR
MAEQATTTKEKTKAKKRYLKRKKERRKVKKHSKPSQTEQGARNVEEDEDEDDMEQDEATSLGESAMQVDDIPVQRPPKKRRKLSLPRSPSEKSPIPVESERVRSPTPLVALPSFPLPALPDAPSQSTLALQGLDQALVDAEIISPSVVTSICDTNSPVGLSKRMVKRLQELGITELFAVQTALLPFLLPDNPLQKTLYPTYYPPRDVCVSAPTGSGKTLAYAVPIVEVLSVRVVTRLRALIVLPTRDLVTQVRETFEAISKGRGLNIGTATGQHSFSHEQSQLVADTRANLLGGSSKIDILICTPGRLIDHVNATPNFSLQHLRFLVIDEADRLLAQSYQDWLVQILAATRPPKYEPNRVIRDLLRVYQESESTKPLPQNDALCPAFLHLLPYPYISTFATERRDVTCQKLLFSATLTRDPSKLAALELRDPKYFVVHRSHQQEDSVLDVVTERFTVPETLTEHMIICSTEEKPLFLFHLVHQNGIANALIFTKSAESTARLVQLFDYFESSLSKSRDSNAKSIIVRAYSSDLGTVERKSILDKFKAKEIQILICSDLISRGIDISHVSHIVSYDAPVDMRKYVHRVGRTARAGRDGSAWTLVEEQEARYFKEMMKNAGHLDRVHRVRVKSEELAPLMPHYQV